MIKLESSILSFVSLPAPFCFPEVKHNFYDP